MYGWMDGMGGEDDSDVEVMRNGTEREWIYRRGGV